MRFRPTLPGILAPLLLLGIVGAMLFGPGATEPGPAHAQGAEEEQFVDLELRLVGEDGPQQGAQIDIYIANLGNLAAYDVEVTLKRERHTPFVWLLSTDPPPETVTDLATN